ncbi:MAG: 16S rRNA (adenine(1518)-N(6)/adenine(1519)-N(6))-dimethyltransferase RsmA [Planctomycetota bacterium]
MAERDPFQRYLKRMAAIGFKPSSTLGQNFLLDPSLHRWIADCAGPTAADTVVEIGVGLGFLTRELAVRAGRVVGVEIDDRLLTIAREELAEHDNVHWVAADALSGPGRTLAPAIGEAARSAVAAGGRCLFVANLPYSVSGPLLAELTALEPLPERAVLLVQKELAQRIAARPGTREYGSLAANVQAVYRAQVLRDVAPQVFRPRPKVVSSVLQLDRRADAPAVLATGEARREFGVFVRQLFQQRRKVLRTTLAAAAAAIGKKQPRLGETDSRSRAEQHGAETLVGWWAACEPAG